MSAWVADAWWAFTIVVTLVAMREVVVCTWRERAADRRGDRAETRHQNRLVLRWCALLVANGVSCVVGWLL